jgi:hypothetical protein
LAFSFMTVVGLGLFSAVRLFRPGAMADLYTKAWLDAILFWGGASPRYQVCWARSLDSPSRLRVSKRLAR